MKTIPFTKMAGAGNDFAVMCAQKNLNYKNLAIKMCDRSSGLGGDGIVILDKSKKADFRMRIFNADGSEAEMCGNGVRCLAAYIVRNKKTSKKLFSIETLAGIIMAEAKDEIAHVRLTDPSDYKANVDININNRTLHAGYIDTGVPHTIVFVDKLEAIDVESIGRTIRYHKAFAPRGTNVNFVEQLKKDLVNARTYERGVENETRACGTGSVACGIVTYLKANPSLTDKKNAVMNVKTRGGEILKVTFDIKQGKISNVWLKGSAKFVAQGEYYV